MQLAKLMCLHKLEQVIPVARQMHHIDQRRPWQHDIEHVMLTAKGLGLEGLPKSETISPN